MSQEEITEELKHEVLPLDLAILDVLPDEGDMLGYHWLGRGMSEVAKTLSRRAGVEMRSSTVSARMRVSHLNGLVIPRSGGAGGKKIWQRTRLGRKVLREMGVPVPKRPDEHGEHETTGTEDPVGKETVDHG